MGGRSSCWRGHGHFGPRSNGIGSEIQISGRSNWTQCCQRLAAALTFFRKELCCPGAMTRRLAPKTPYTLWRNTASIIKDLILIYLVIFCLILLQSCKYFQCFSFCYLLQKTVFSRYLY